MISLKNILLKEYSDKVINNTIERWRKEKPDLDDNQAKAIIQRFEQVKPGLSSKLDIITLSDELRKSNNYLNIDKYSLADMVALLRSIPEKEDKIKKEAAKKFAKEAGIPETTTRQYVARFFGNKDNLKFAAREGNDQFSKEEILNFIPRNLQREEMFLDPRNWRWEKFEQMMDALFPYYGSTEGGDENFATTDADKVYDKDGIEIYKADDVNKCIAYNPVDPKTNRKMYGWCVSQVGNANYDYYRFEERSPTFYFVFDRNKTSEKKGGSFIDKWHAFVVQVNKNPKQDETYRITSAANDSDTRAATWEDISKIVPSDTWSKIKGLKDYFKPIDLSPVERGRKFASGKNLSLDEFKELSTDEKILYIQGKASKNSISRDILEILPKIKIPLEGRSTTLANIAIDSGQEFPYSILKNYESLAKRYAIYRFRHTDYSKNAIPLPYVKYLDDNAKEKYIETYDNSLNFDYVLRFFGKDTLKSYVNKKADKMDFIYPEKYVNLIEDENKKTLYKLYNKLISNWDKGDNFGISEEQLETLKEAPEQSLTPVPIFYDDINNFSPQELKSLINLSKKLKGEEYSAWVYALPYVINYKGRDLLLVPESKENEYNDWYLIDENGKKYKHISGDSKIGDDDLSGGYPDVERMNKYYNFDDIKLNILNENKKYSFLAEIKIEKPKIFKFIITHDPTTTNGYELYGDLLINNKKISNHSIYYPSENKIETAIKDIKNIPEIFQKYFTQKFKNFYILDAENVKIENPKNLNIIPILDEPEENDLGLNEIKRMQLLAGINEVKINQPGLVDTKTDGIRGKDVKVRKLDLIYKDGYSELYWCEYPKGYLDILFLDKEENDWLTDLDVGIEALEGLTEISPDRLYKNALKKYNLKPKKGFGL